MRKLHKVLTVTVALSALNEEGNIKSFLKSVLSQKEEGFLLKKILIISDGSTDKTVLLAKSFKNKKIEIRDYKERMGKSVRLNEIYKSVDTDILIQSDADVLFASPFVFRDVLLPFLKDLNVCMAGGHTSPMPSKTFVGKAISCTSNAYGRLRSVNNSLSVTGPLLAYRKKLYKRLNIPKNMIGNDVFTYFKCLTLGYKYQYVPSAVAYFHTPQTLKDQIKQNTRFEAAPIRMSRYFSVELVNKESYIPLANKFVSFGLEFLRHPILCTYIFFVNTYCRINALLVEPTLNGKWAIADSSKKFNNGVV